MALLYNAYPAAIRSVMSDPQRRRRVGEFGNAPMAGDGSVIRVNGAYLYELGPELRSLNSLPEDADTELVNLYFALTGARSALRSFIFASIFSESIRLTAQASTTLLNLIDEIAPANIQDVEFDTIVPRWKVYQIKNEFRKFETVMLAELQASALYVVSAKGGFDTLKLTDAGDELFPSDLGLKVPGAISDVRAGARCIAFDLCTAAGFHFHRANEAVLRVYFDEVAGKGQRPRSRNMGDYLKKMEKLGVGDQKVIDVLKSLKDLHRNPLMHPEDVIQSTDEAVSLYAAIRAAIGYMLDRIPIPNP